MIITEYNLEILKLHEELERLREEYEEELRGYNDNISLARAIERVQRVSSRYIRRLRKWKKALL